MKTELLKITKGLEQGTITEQEARTLLLGLFGVIRSSSNEKKSLNDFIIEALQVSNDKKKLPFIIQYPNGLEVFPSIKMKFENYGSPLLGDVIESMVITWRE